ncbi:hypothetical protein BH20ACT2_BH20ACT2_19530 [soil metagenome]
MVIWVFVFVGAVAVFVIAAVVVGREAGSLATEPPRSVFDLGEAVDFVADRLPGWVTAELSHEEVADVLGWHLDHLAAAGVTVAPGRHDDNRPGNDGPALVTDDDAVAYVLGRAEEAGSDLTDEQIAAVIEADAAYFRAIGAIGAEVPLPDDPSG